MTLKDFAQKVTERGWKILGVKDDPKLGEAVIVDAAGQWFAIAVSDIPNHPWEELEGMLTLKRRADNCHRMSRICGYFSLLHSWNRSKLAELADRHKGQYGV